MSQQWSLDVAYKSLRQILATLVGLQEPGLTVSSAALRGAKDLSLDSCIPVEKRELLDSLRIM